MEGESPTKAGTPTGAVFLSYASEDAEVTGRICDALRAAGIEVWFDQSELRGGDAWDQSIRKQIKNCALFIPVISKNTHDRDEGYFRLEWKLAADRSHLMAADKAFLLPVVIDSTPQTDERIPDRFRELQWSRVPEGQVPPAFIARVQRLLSPLEGGEPTGSRHVTRSVSAATPVSGRVGASWSASNALRVAAIVLVLGALAYLTADKWLPSKHPALAPARPDATANSSEAPAAFSPPPHSIAVLPFVNMSGDKEQEYFSDGLTEELLNSLARINELQVAARTSAFSFKGKDIDIGTIGRKLNVGAILEGSVRRAGHTVRITAQLNNAVTGFHLWSQTYDRDLSDVLALQTEIANAVAGALKVTLLGDAAAKIGAGGTRNPAAFDAYLRASKAFRELQNAEDAQATITLYTEATRLDPEYALAYSGRSLAFNAFATDFTTGPGARSDYLNKARGDARKAIALAPDLAQSHLALASLLESLLDFTGASQEYGRALALEPGNATLLAAYGWFAVQMGKTEAGLVAARRAVALDPLNFWNHLSLGKALMFARRYPEAITAITDARALSPNDWYASSWLGFAYHSSGDFRSAQAAFESVQPANNFNRLEGLAMAYDKLGRHADAETLFAQARASQGNNVGVFYAMIYAQWGDTARALDWLEAAMRQRDPYLEYLKTAPLLDPLRKEPRFKAIERELKFPD